MTYLELTKSLFLLHIVFIVSYAVFALFKQLSRPLRLAFTFRHLRLIAQQLVVVSLLSVPLLPFAPLVSVPELNVPEFKGTMSIDSLQAIDFAKVETKKKNEIKVPSSSESKTGLFKNSILKILDLVKETLAKVFILFYISGFLFVTVRKLVHYRRLKKLLRSAMPIREVGKVSIVVSDTVEVPFSTFVGGRAFVALPSGSLENGNDFRIAVFHELQHHRQGDTRWILFFEFLLCLLFPNPIIYLWKKQLTELQEFSCDEALVGQNKVSSTEYGECLVRVAESVLTGRHPHVGTACMTDFQPGKKFNSILGRRIVMLGSYRFRRNSKRYYSVAAGIITAALTVAVAYGTQQPFREREGINVVNKVTAVWDPEVLEIANAELKAGVEAANASSGFAIVADPNNGRILAVANISTRPKADFTKNWSLSLLMEPTSVMKGITTAVALDRGVTTADEKHPCEKTSKYGKQNLKDWKAFSQLSTASSVAQSSNLCQLKIAEKIGEENIFNALRTFGFGKDGVTKDFPEARAGILPHPENVLTAAALGMDFLASPLEIVQAYGAIANGGNLMKPQFASKSDETGVVLRRVLSQETSSKMREILTQVVNEGTGRYAKSKYFSTAGKTGSGSVSKPDARLQKDNETNTASFVGFAPAKNPRVEVYVVLAGPADVEMTGGAVAAPVFRRISERVLEQMGVARDVE